MLENTLEVYTQSMVSVNECVVGFYLYIRNFFGIGDHIIACVGLIEIN